MNLLKRLLTGLLGVSMLFAVSACSQDDTADADGTAADTAVTNIEEAGKPYTIATFPKDATEVRYSDFGAVGDGVTDDQKAISTAHAIANARNLPVKADEGMTYYINAADAFSPAVIQTDTDWTGASFIIDDRDINYDGHHAQNVSVFSVEPSLERIDLSLGALSMGDTNIGVAPGQDCLVYLRCDDIKHYIRYGANADSGQSQTEVLIVDAEGNIDPSTPLTWDYPTVDRAYGIPTEETPITIRGGEFLTLANEIDPDRYISVARNINITRSNVTVEGVKHTIEQTKDYRAAYGGFFNVTYCNNVTIRDCEIMCHRDSYFNNGSGKVLLGSYEFLASYTNNLQYVNCVQTNLFDENGVLISQGCMGTNYCRNISMTDCTIARFDAHCQVYNVTIRGCEMERINLIGFGTALVEDTTIHDRFIFNLRYDYGSMFAGDVILRNVNMVKAGTQRLALFDGAWYNHDFGYPVYLPQKVTIENLTVPEGAFVTAFTSAFDSYEDVTQTTLRDGTENKNPLYLPQTMEVISNPAGTRFRSSVSGISFPDFTGETGSAFSADGGGIVDVFSYDFNADFRTTGDGFIETISDFAHNGGVGSAILYDGNEVHSNMNLKQITVDGDNRALLWTGCGNPNAVSKTSNITLDVKPASGAQNMDAFVYQDYAGRDFVISFDIRAVEHEEYSKVTSDLVRLTSFYSPKDKDGNTVTYSESLLSMDCNTYEVKIAGMAGRKAPKIGVVVPNDRFMNLAVHVHPVENTFDLYVDGEMLASDVMLMSKSSQKLIGTYNDKGELVLSEKENPMEDFCISYARLCNTNGWTIEGDIFMLDNVKMYFSETYQK